MIIDQLGRKLRVPLRPLRIVSLVPSQTELLFDLGCGDRVVGVTKFCIHPGEARKKAAIIGGTKNFNFDQITALSTDLIIGNKEENYQVGIEKLAESHPVWLSDISDLTSALDMIRQIGILVDEAEKAAALAAEISTAFASLAPVALVSAAYFIWRKPYMVAATETFVDAMLQRAGFINVFSHLARYPEISVEQLASAAPERIFLSSEPYPFSAKHLAEFQEICPAAKIQIVDGELFSWYGSRLLQSVAYFKQLQQG